MMHMLFKKTRNNGKSRTWYGRYKYDWMPVFKEVNLGVTDKQVADQKLRAIEKEAENENAGLISPRTIRDASKIEISQHLADFIQDRETLGRTAHYTQTLESCIQLVCNECGWKYLNQIKADQFELWRSSKEISRKTLNEYLAALNGFLKWLSDRNRITDNPLKIVKKVDMRGHKKRQRRAMTESEIDSLLAVAPLVRKIAYLFALYCGFRRGEIEQLEWTDFIHNAQESYMNLRARITKNRKESSFPLRPELVALLLELKQSAGDSKYIIGRLPRMRDMLEDWKAAGIKHLDSQGRISDLHSLRMTFCTMLEAAGVPPRIAQEAMRHSDPSLTANIYTDPSRFNLRGAVNSLPSFAGGVLKKGALIGASFAVKTCQNLSFAVTSEMKNLSLQVTGNEHICHDLSLPVKGRRMEPTVGFEPTTC